MEAEGFEELRGAIAVLRREVRAVQDGLRSRAEAAELVGIFAEAERLGAAGRTVSARRVERAGSWRAEGHRSAAHWMAGVTGMPVGGAVGALETARRLEHLPATADAFCAGELAETRVREVAAAAASAPGSEPELLEAARTESAPALRNRCHRVRARAGEAEEAHERIRRSRYFRHWTDPEGAVRLEARLAPEDGARVLAGMEPHLRRIAAQARAAGIRESNEAHAADALVALAASGPGPGATVHVRVDREALLRGRAEGDESCEIEGVGPVPVSVARRLASDALLEAIVAEGTELTHVLPLGRSVPRRLRRALEAREPTCAVPGCDARENLEIDHLVPWAEGGPTTLDNLVRLCGWHHGLKTHRGFRLAGRPGEWTWRGPDRRRAAVASAVISSRLA